MAVEAVEGEPNAESVEVLPKADGVVVVVDVLLNADEVGGKAVEPELPVPKTDEPDWGASWLCFAACS